MRVLRLGFGRRRRHTITNMFSNGAARTFRFDLCNQELLGERSQNNAPADVTRSDRHPYCAPCFPRLLLVKCADCLVQGSSGKSGLSLGCANLRSSTGRKMSTAKVRAQRVCNGKLWCQHAVRIHSPAFLEKFTCGNRRSCFL